jgi:hypothetical protein
MGYMPATVIAGSNASLRCQFEVTIDQRLDVLAPESVPLPPIRQTLLDIAQLSL